MDGIAKGTFDVKLSVPKPPAYLKTDMTLSVEITSNKLRLTLSGVNDAAVERLAMQSKGDLFHDVFGLQVVLVEQG